MDECTITIVWNCGAAALLLPRFLDVATEDGCAKYFKLLLANEGNECTFDILDSYLPAWANEASTPQAVMHADAVLNRWTKLKQRYGK